MLRVLIADDHTDLRKELCQIIKRQATDIEIDEAANGEEVLVKIEQTTYDLLIMDISMPGRNGLEVLREVHHAYPTLPVLIMSMHPEEIYANRALKSGASGYLPKGAAPDKLVSAIQKIVAGGKYITEKLAKSLKD